MKTIFNQITNVVIKSVMVGLTTLAVSGLGLLIFKLVTNPTAFDSVGGMIK